MDDMDDIQVDSRGRRVPRLHKKKKAERLLLQYLDSQGGLESKNALLSKAFFRWAKYQGFFCANHIK